MHSDHHTILLFDACDEAGSNHLDKSGIFDYHGGGLECSAS